MSQSTFGADLSFAPEVEWRATTLPGGMSGTAAHYPGDYLRCAGSHDRTHDGEGGSLFESGRIRRQHSFKPAWSNLWLPPCRLLVSRDTKRKVAVAVPDHKNALSVRCCILVGCRYGRIYCWSISVVLPNVKLLDFQGRFHEHLFIRRLQFRRRIGFQPLLGERTGLHTEQSHFTLTGQGHKY
jgi:hypothetical protein